MSEKGTKVGIFMAILFVLGYLLFWAALGFLVIAALIKFVF